METPSSSSRRITRSQTSAMAANNSIPISSKKNEESENGVLKSRSALIDITNDSPIVGLAIGSFKTPSSNFSKKIMIKSTHATTPGSGEALLRGQVKTLLQKVEEEAVISKISFEPRNLILEKEGFVNSPIYLLAPTPANTPQVSDLCENESETLTVSEIFKFSQQDQEEENGKTLVTKLLFTEGCDSSVHKEDDSSVWSVQVNASTSDKELEENYEDEICEDLCEW